MLWRQLLEELEHDVDLPSLEIIKRPIDTGYPDILADAADTPAPPIQAGFLVEDTLSQFGEMLTQCLETQRLAQSIEVQVLESALEQWYQRESSKNLSEQDSLLKELQSVAVGNAPALRIQDGVATPSGVLSQKWTDYLGKKNDFHDLVKKRWDAFVDRTNQPGSGSHFGERFDALRASYAFQVRVAHSLMVATATGLRGVYGITLDLPPISEHGYVAAMTRWLEVARWRMKVDIARLHRETVVLPLHQKDGTILSSLDFFAGAENGLVDFSLKQEHFGNRLNIRLRNLGVYFAPEGREGWFANTTQDLFMSTVQLPPQLTAAWDGKGWKSSAYVPRSLQVPITSAAVESPLSCVDRAMIHNLSPLGRWSIRLAKWSYLDQRSDKDTKFNNIILIMDIVSR